MTRIFARDALLPHGWARDVAIAIGGNGRILTVEENASSDGAKRHRAAGVSNLHSHTFQRAMAGLSETRGGSERDSFWTWREIMYRFLDILSPDEIEAIAAYAFMEMQEAGFGAVAEFHYLHHGPGGVPYADPAELAARILAAAETTGIGLTLLPVFYAQGGVDGRPLAGGQLRFGNDFDSFTRIVADARQALKSLPADTGFGLAPHSLRAVGAADLARLEAMLPSAPFHMHIAEQEREIDEAMAVFGRRPVEWLLDHCDVDARWCLVHATHMNTAETERLARSGATAGLCPVTEANLGDGIFDGARHAAAGGTFGIGSDSNIRISLAEELRQLEYAQRLRDRARVVLADPGGSAGRRLYQTALRGGARALGRDSGTIEAGRWADLLALDPGGFSGRRDGDGLLDGWIFTGGNDAVTDLWSAGRHVVVEGRHVARAAVASRYDKALTSIFERL